MGSGAGCSNLGDRYDDGEGVAKDQKKAVQLYDKACSMGIDVGCLRIGNRYYHGDSVAKDHKKATQSYDKACSLGNDEACRYAKSLRGQ